MALPSERPEKGDIILLQPDVAFCISQGASPMEQPWIAEILSVTDQDGLVSVHWYCGTIRGSWDKAYLKPARGPRKAYIENVHVNSILLSKIKFLT